MWRLQVVMVWDAMNGAGMGAVSSEMRCGIEIIYSGASEADTFIMKLVHRSATGPRVTGGL